MDSIRDDLKNSFLWHYLLLRFSLIKPPSSLLLFIRVFHRVALLLFLWALIGFIILSFGICIIIFFLSLQTALIVQFIRYLLRIGSIFLRYFLVISYLWTLSYLWLSDIKHTLVGALIFLQWHLDINILLLSLKLIFLDNLFRKMLV